MSFPQMPSQVTRKITLSHGLLGQDEHIEALYNLWEQLQPSSVEAIQAPDMDLLSFIPETAFFGLIFKNVYPKKKKNKGEKTGSKTGKGKGKATEENSEDEFEGDETEEEEEEEETSTNKRREDPVTNKAKAKRERHQFRRKQHTDGTYSQTNAKSNLHQTKPMSFATPAFRRIWKQNNAIDDSEGGLHLHSGDKADELSLFGMPAHAANVHDTTMGTTAGTEAEPDTMEPIPPEDPYADVMMALETDLELNSDLERYDSHESLVRLTAVNEPRMVAESFETDIQRTPSPPPPKVVSWEDHHLQERTSTYKFGITETDTERKGRLLTNEPPSFRRRIMRRDLVGFVYISLVPGPTTPTPSPSPEGNIGIVLDPAHRNRGYAHEAMELTLKWAVDSAKFRRLNARIMHSEGQWEGCGDVVGLFSRFGFTYEGTHRRSIYHPLTCSYMDLTHYALLDTDWALRSYHPNPAPRVIWEEVFARHARERRALLRWDVNSNGDSDVRGWEEESARTVLRKSASMVTIKQEAMRGVSEAPPSGGDTDLEDGDGYMTDTTTSSLGEAATRIRGIGYTTPDDVASIASRSSSRSRSLWDMVGSGVESDDGSESSSLSGLSAFEYPDSSEGFDSGEDYGVDSDEALEDF